MKSPKTVPQKIVDKNGKPTTVYVNPSKNSKAGASKLPGPKVQPSNGSGIHLATGPRSKWGIKDFMYRYSVVDKEILDTYHKTLNYRDEAIVRFADERRKVEDAAWKADSKPLARDDFTAPVVIDTPFDSPWRDGDERYGYSNELGEVDEVRESLRDLDRTISALWLQSCSSAEAHALLRYTGESDEYAKQHSEGELSQKWRDFEAAVERAPDMAPFVVYSGVNYHYVNDLLAEAGSGEINFTRVISTSYNPAQVNGFATEFPSHNHDEFRESNGLYQKRLTLALEIETTKAGFMGAISRVAHEMEVLVPKGRYEVIEIVDNVKYLWGHGGNRRADESPSGRTMDKVIRLRYLGE